MIQCQVRNLVCLCIYRQVKPNLDWNKPFVQELGTEHTWPQTVYLHKCVTEGKAQILLTIRVNK